MPEIVLHKPVTGALVRKLQQCFSPGMPYSCHNNDITSLEQG
jgi:hypothetical protein